MNSINKLLMLVGVMLAAGLTAVAANYDLNGDGAVDRADCEMMRAAVLSRTAPVQWDVNGDGSVDVIDLNALTNYAFDGREPATLSSLPHRATGTASLPSVSAPNVTITPSDVGQVIEIPITLTMPEGDDFTNLQMTVKFPDGLEPIAVSEDYGIGGTDIPSGTVVFSDNFNDVNYWPDYVVLGINSNKKRVTKNPCHIYTMYVTPQAGYSTGTRNMYIYLKYTRYDDVAREIGSCMGLYSERCVEDYVLCSFNFKGESPTQPSRFDLNGDGVVDRADYTLLVTRIADQAVYNSQFDLDGNGTVDVLDANLLLEELDTQPLSTQTYTVNGESFKMVPVEGGTFTMGASEDDYEAFSYEKPAHEVTLSRFSIGQTEVTQALWQAVMGSNPSYFNGYGNSDYDSYHSNYDYGTNLQRPVEWVSWADCQAFITKLNQLTGKQFRLPTEAEWEYAARGGNKSQGYKYAGSNTIGDVAWYTSNSSSTTHPIGTKQANELGLYDMSGNVLEWCQDWVGSYSSGAQTNPTGPSSGSPRVRRGGSWSDTARCCRVSYRNSYTPTLRYFNLGLRLAL